jgi:hypothetical protein
MGKKQLEIPRLNWQKKHTEYLDVKVPLYFYRGRMN